MSDFIKRPILEDCSVNTLISYVPDLINNNNKEIKRVFEDIFEFGTDEKSTQYIKTPINTKGIVKGNSGQFYNLYVSHLKLDSASLSNDFLEVAVKHQNCPDRFKLNISSNDKDASTKINTINTFAHDSDNIFYDYQYDNESIVKNLSVKDYLVNITDKINMLEGNNNTNNTSINNLDASIKELYSMIESIVSKLNIEKEATPQEDENVDLVNAYNNPTKSYTYSAEKYK